MPSDIIGQTKCQSFRTVARALDITASSKALLNKHKPCVYYVSYDYEADLTGADKTCGETTIDYYVI